MSLDNLKTRLKYHGGKAQIDRMILDKERSLKDALLYSYQSATAVLHDGREFRCLINPNKISMELDDKMLSIPFKDIPLNKEASVPEEIGVKCGDVIEWKENGTHWIIYLRYLQEVAYFRGLMRQCENEPLEVDGEQFWYYLKGPDEKSIEWQKTKHFIFNELNYTLEMYISNTSATKQFFHRFNEIKVKGRNFEVQAVDDLSIDGLLTVYLKETYSNKWELPKEEASTPPIEQPDSVEPMISGPAQCYPYDIIEYKVLNTAGGAWSLSNKRAVIVKQDEQSVTVEITTGKSGAVSLIYSNDNGDIVFNIEILSL